MYERDVDNPDNNDTLLSIPPLVEYKEEKVDGFRSRVTRDGTTSLEIDIRRQGLNCCGRFCLACVLAVVVIYLVFHIVLLQIQLHHFGAVALPLLAFIVIPVLIMLCVPSCVKTVFTHVNVTITRDSYCLTQKNITWKSCFQITCFSSHFNDLESGQLVETTVEESQHVRYAGLQAEIVTHVEKHHYMDVEHRGDREIVTYRTEYSEWKDIKLGATSFGTGIDDEDLEWLVEETNCFLRDTS